MTLNDRVVVISGASGGLGRVVTRFMAERGARLALLGRSAERLEQLAGETGLLGDEYLALPVDLANPVEAEAAAKAVTGKFGKVDALVHLVGGWIGGKPVVEVDPFSGQRMGTSHYRFFAVCSFTTCQGSAVCYGQSSPRSAYAYVSPRVKRDGCDIEHPVG